MKKYLYIILLLFIFSIIIPNSLAKFRSVNEVSGSIIIPEDNYCINNNIDTLSDCMLLMDNYGSSVTDSINNINSKGSPDFSSISPLVTYSSKLDNNIDSDYSFSDSITGGSSYTYNSNTGIYNITNTKKIGTDNNSYTNYYTCLNNSVSCSKMYKIISDNYTDLYNINKVDVYSSNILENVDSLSGLYKMNDDIGVSYYYRGNVKNNYVTFNDNTWRIIRRNGDGSIRLVLDGDIGNSKYNVISKHPMFSSYMTTSVKSKDYKVSSSFAVIGTFDSNVTYAKSFTVTDDFQFSVENSDKVTKIFENEKDYLFNNGYKYTCLNYESTSCDILYEILSDTNAENKVNVRVYYLHPDKYEDTFGNDVDSTIKTYLDNYYEENFVGKVDSNNNLFTDYIGDGIYCNDRGINYGDGISYQAVTIYNGHNRASTNKPSLLCNSKFVYNISNNKLKYPIGLITLDEVLLAGSKYGSTSPLNYLNYDSNKTYWTMTPSLFDAGYSISNIAYVGKNSSINFYDSITSLRGVRPVINIKSDIKISGGDGTIDNPYTLYKD